MANSLGLEKHQVLLRIYVAISSETSTPMFSAFVCWISSFDIERVFPSETEEFSHNKLFSRTKFISSATAWNFPDFLETVHDPEKLSYS